MTDITIADRIAAVQLEVSRMQANAGDWKLYLEKLPPESTGHKSAMISLKHMARLNDAIATLQSYERLQAEHECAMNVVEAAQSAEAAAYFYDGFNPLIPEPQFSVLKRALAAYDAALATREGEHEPSL